MDTTTGVMSMQEALQKDRGLRLDRGDEQRTIAVSELVLPALDAHPFAAMQAKLPEPGAGAPEPLAAAVPAEFWYARVDDSRWTGILPNVIKGPMVVGGASRLVYCDDKRALATGLVETADIVPTGATAIAYNLTVTTTTGQGYLAVEPGGAASFGGSAINWSPGPVSLANASLAKPDTQLHVSVFVRGQPAAQHARDLKQPVFPLAPGDDGTQGGRISCWRCCGG